MNTWTWRRKNEDWCLYLDNIVILTMTLYQDIWMPLISRRAIGLEIITEIEADIFWRWAMGNLINTNESTVVMDTELVVQLKKVAEDVGHLYQLDASFV